MHFVMIYNARPFWYHSTFQNHHFQNVELSKLIGVPIALGGLYLLLGRLKIGLAILKPAPYYPLLLFFFPPCVHKLCSLKTARFCWKLNFKVCNQPGFHLIIQSDAVTFILFANPSFCRGRRWGRGPSDAGGGRGAPMEMICRGYTAKISRTPQAILVE